MISLEKYIDKKDFQFKLPLPVFDKLKLLFDMNFLTKIPFRKKVFVSSKRNTSIYFEMLLSFFGRKIFFEREKIFCKPES